MVILADAMITDLKKISSESSVTQAAKRMRAERVGALVIERVGTFLKDREGQIVGLITEADIVRKAVAEEVDLAKSTVDQFMTSPMFTVEATWPLTEAYDMMREGGVRHLLVTQDKKVVGIVSIRDLLVRLQR
jgi:signal-transduction protein with cAMP-binding, CBS, and nucleotidyltransferase domain